MIIMRILEIFKKKIKTYFQINRKKICQKHKNILDQLRNSLESRYKVGAAESVGKPLYKNRNEDEKKFNEYIRSGHFHKNLHINYHALWKLFCHHEEIPEKFYVYDIACGPYTATISLLNFLHNHRCLKGKSFQFTFCDMGDLVLEKLCQENKNKDNHILSFPVPLDLFPGQHNLSKGEILNTFKLNDYEIHIRQCCNKNNCKTLYEIDNSEKHQVANSLNHTGINIIFCSFVGNYGEPKFINKCTKEVLCKFTSEQKLFSTYIIYSHYLKKSSWKEKIKNDIENNLSDFSPKLIDDDRGEAIPFRNSYFYYIYKLDSRGTQ